MAERTRSWSLPLNTPVIKIEDMNSQAQMGAAQHMAQGGGGGGAQPLNLEKIAGQGGADAGDDDDMPDLEPTEEETGEVDESGLDPKDIELVMKQVCWLHRPFHCAVY